MRNLMARKTYKELRAEQEALHVARIEAALEYNRTKLPTQVLFALAQAEELVRVVEKTGVVFAVSHNYTGYPLVRQAREMIQSGELGEIQAIRSNYIQGWLRSRLESEGQKQAAWRTDPGKSGIAGCFGDIATHAMITQIGWQMHTNKYHLKLGKRRQSLLTKNR